MSKPNFDQYLPWCIHHDNNGIWFIHKEYKKSPSSLNNESWLLLSNIFETYVGPHSRQLHYCQYVAHPLELPGLFLDKYLEDGSIVLKSQFNLNEPILLIYKDGIWTQKPR
jgi:hypothetical protein